MTQQDDITQRVLTDDEIRDIITGTHQAFGEFKSGYMLVLGRAIESALLSKLRAPVADERVLVQFGDVGCAGPFPVVDGRIVLSSVTMNDLAYRMASAPVAGEAVTWEAVRQELAIFLMGATGRSSKEWHRPLDNASEGGALARMRACLAAPQASAENVRNAALEEAAKLMDQTLRSNGAALIRGLKRSQAEQGERDAK